MGGADAPALWHHIQKSDTQVTYFPNPANQRTLCIYHVLCEENKITNHDKIPIAYLKVTWLCEENKITIRRKNFASKFLH